MMIGGQDWSDALFEASNWRSNGVDSSGLVKTTCQLTLKEVRGLPGSLNDRTNPLFRTGTPITIDVSNSSGILQRHPAGALRIQRAEYNYENRALTIDCVCLATLLSYRQPTDPDKAEIEPGQSTDRFTVIQKLLNAAGITLINSPGFIPYPINYKFNPGGSYIETAGQMLYSAGYFGWIDGSEVFQILPVALTTNAAITFQIGGDLGDELWYRRLTNPESPRDVIKVTGMKRLAQIPQYPNETISLRMGAASTVDPNLGNEEIVVEKTQIDEDYNQRTLSKRLLVYTAFGLVLPDDNSMGKTSLILSEETLDRKYYSRDDSGEDGKLERAEIDTFKLVGAVLGEYIKAIEEEDAIFYGRLNSFAAQSVEISYKYNSKNRIKSITTTKRESLGALLERTNFDWSTLSSIPTDLHVSERTVESWKKGQSAREWTHKIEAYKAFSRVKPEAIKENFTIEQRIALVADPSSSKIETSNSGQTVPPATERRPADAGFEDKQVCGEVTFNYGGNPYVERSRTYQIEYLQGGVVDDDDDLVTSQKAADEKCTDPQCQAIARIEGQLLYGRSKGQDLGTELKDELLQWRPLMRVNCVEPDGTVRAFAIDDANWYLGAERAICNFGLIWVGDMGQSTVLPPYRVNTPISPLSIPFQTSVRSPSIY